MSVAGGVTIFLISILGAVEIEPRAQGLFLIQRGDGGV